MKGSNMPSGLGLRHDALVEKGLQDRLYKVTVVLRMKALDEQEAQEVAQDMVDNYNVYRWGINDAAAADGPAVVVRRITVAAVTPETTESGGR